MAKKVWGILYPFIVFIAVQVVVAAVAGAVYAVVKTISSGGEMLTPEDISAMNERLLAEWGLLITAISEIISAAVMLPIFLAGRKKSPRFEKIPLAPVCAASVLFVVGAAFASEWLIGLTGINENSAMFDRVVDMIYGSAMVWQILAVTILAPVAEELCFRGVILKRALAFMSPQAAVVVSAALFALMHGNIPQGLFAFAVGLAIGAVYVRYRSLAVCIAAHAVVNALSVILTAALPEDAKALTAVIISAAIALGAAALWFLLKKIPAAREIEKETVTVD